MENLCDKKEKNCHGRREFLVSASALAGGLVLSLANPDNAKATAIEGETVVKLSADSPLNKVGGSVLADTPSGKVIIARTGENSYAAVSAVCTHKGKTLGYDASAKVFACPAHGSRFNSDGSNAGGPAQSPVKSFKSQSALIVSE